MNENETIVTTPVEEEATPIEETAQETIAETTSEEVAPMIMSTKDMVEVEENIRAAKEQIEEIASVTGSLLTMKYDCSEEDAERFYKKMQTLVKERNVTNEIPEGETGVQFTSDEKNEFFRYDDGRDYTNEEALEHNEEYKNMQEYREAIFDDLLSAVAEESDQIKNLEKIEAEFNAKKEAQIKYLNSKEYQEKKEKSYRELEQKYNEETDPEKKAVFKKSYEFLTSLRTFDYLFTRLTKNKDSEVKNIVDTFFDSTRSKYVLDRYFNKFKQLNKVKGFGIDGKSIFYFMHLECKLLPEEYHPFDGFFLFNVIRFIAYINANESSDLIFVQNILLNLKKLFYHEFATPEDEAKFVAVITGFEDNFMTYADMFKEKNDSYTSYKESDDDASEDAAVEDTNDASEDVIVEDTNEDASVNNTLFTMVGSNGVSYDVTKIENEEGFKIFVNGRPVIKPSELNPAPTTVCYLDTTNGSDKPVVKDTGITIDEFLAKLEETNA